MKSWETVRGVQDQVQGGAVKEEDLSELLKLQKKVKNKVQQSESILNLTSSFHLTAKQVSNSGTNLILLVLVLQIFLQHTKSLNICPVMSHRTTKIINQKQVG